MKKLSILLLLPFFIACSSDDNERMIEPTETTISFFHTGETYTANNASIGYFAANGDCKLIAELGDMTANKPSVPVTLPSDTITRVYFFTYVKETNIAKRTDYTFMLDKHKANKFEVKGAYYAIQIDVDNPKEYPH